MSASATTSTPPTTTNNSNSSSSQQTPRATHTNTATTTYNFTRPKLLLLFDHRSIFDVTDADYLEIEAWEEALSNFGVEGLTRSTFFENMSQKSESDVMKAMCPFTTKLEWDSFLTKRRQKMNHELEDWCFANCVPIPGFAEFVEACQREFEDNSISASAKTTTTSTAKNENDNDNDNDDGKNEQQQKITTTTTTMTVKSPDCLALWLTPWRIEQAQSVLGTCSLKSHVSPAVVESSDFTFVDALEVLGLRPPVETPSMLEELAKYRVEPSTESLIQRRNQTLETAQSSALNDKNNNNNDKNNSSSSSSSSSQHQQQQTKVIVFTNSARLAKQARNCGLIAVGISYNSYDQEEDEKVLLDGCDNEADLLNAGCRVVLPDYTKFQPKYLRML